MSKGRHINKGGARTGRTDTRAYTGADIERVRRQMEEGRLNAPARSDVRHVCPECGGGPLTNTQSGLVVVQTCPMCKGDGTISDEQARRLA